MGWSIHHPVGLIHHTPAACQRGYTLFRPRAAGRTRTSLIWRATSSTGGILLRVSTIPTCWTTVTCFAVPYRPRTPAAVETVGGSSASIIELDWDSNLVWAYRDNTLHHDYERLPNGNTLLLMWDPIPEDLVAQVQGGFDVDFAPGCLATWFAK